MPRRARTSLEAWNCVEDAMKFYVKTFLISAVGFGAFFHFVTRQPMPWWPDTAIMGLTFGIIATLAAFRSRMDRETNRRLWSALKAVLKRPNPQ
jgi:hypothetical protein